MRAGTNGEDAVGKWALKSDPAVTGNGSYSTPATLASKMSGLYKSVDLSRRLTTAVGNIFGGLAFAFGPSSVKGGPTTSAPAVAQEQNVVPMSNALRQAVAKGSGDATQAPAVTLAIVSKYFDEMISNNKHGGLNRYRRAFITEALRLINWLRSPMVTLEAVSAAKRGILKARTYGTY